MIEVDPVTQCEKYSTGRKGGLPNYMVASMMMYASMAGSFGLLPPMPRFKPGHEPWYFIDLSKKERANLTYEESMELRKYKWTLKHMEERND